MPSHHRPILRFAAIMIAIGFVGACGGAEPRAAFLLKGGWVEIGLKHDGQPVVNAIIQVTDEQGKPFAEGQTEDDGSAAFPVPRGSSFLVEIKTGDRTSDPIRLFKNEKGIEPARVLLSYGLRPCCRFLSQKSVGPPAEAPVETGGIPKDEFPIGSFSAALLATFLAGSAIWYLWKR